MSLIKVTGYYSYWDDKNNTGKIILYDQGSNTLFEREYSDQEEFHILFAKLRKEKPIWFGTNAEKPKKGTVIRDEPVAIQVK